jgi:hypothetical protein
MERTLWIIAGVLAALMLATGLFKLAQPKKALADRGIAWVEDFSPGAIKTIGAAEVLGALGLILPAAVRIAPIVVPIAAACIAALLTGAVIVHARRREGFQAVPAAVLLVLAAIVAWGRFGPYAF